MKFDKRIKQIALLWGEKHIIAHPSQIVETLWGDWKKPHRVMIYRVKVQIVIKENKKGRSVIGLSMAYYAMRLNKLDTPKDKVGEGIVLTNLHTLSGKKWVFKGTDFNHNAMSWTVAQMK